MAGARLEPLLGDHDAGGLGIVNFKPEGHAPEGEKGDESHEYGDKGSMPAMLRQAGKRVITERPPLHEVETKGKEEANRIVSRYKGPVFTDKVGRMKVEEVRLRYEEGFKPVQPARYQVPYHYQERLEVHLKKLEKEGVIEKVNPAEAVNCILNIDISEKKAQGCIRMNIDARPYNKGAKHTR